MATTIRIAGVSRLTPGAWISRAVMVTLVCIVLALVCVRLFMSRSDEDWVRLGEVADFQHLANVAPGTRGLMCPQNFCNQAADDSPIFDLSVDDLRDRWTEMVAREPRLKLVAGDGDLTRVTYIQHSLLLTVPDIVTVQFIAVDAHHATLAIESQSRYPLFDFGGNRRRVRSWVHQLQRSLRKAHPGAQKS